METLYEVLDQGRIGIIESPTGTVGMSIVTVSLICLGKNAQSFVWSDGLAAFRLYSS